jgi:hypothetical protein
MIKASMSISSATKRQWFERGARAFGDAAPRYLGQGYCCPICLGISSSMSMFTVEHVPPDSVGGRPLILTCQRCNGTAGTTVDWHWSNFTDVEGLMSGSLPEPVTVNLTYEGLKVVAEVSNKGDGYVLRVVEKASKKANIEQFEDLIKAAIDAGETPSTLNIQMHKSRYREQLLKVSVLRAAYLTGVAMAGYRVITFWNPIRMQILSPETADPSLSGLMRYEREHAPDRRILGEINKPDYMRCICVGFGRWTVFLPLAADSVLYRSDELAGQRFEFSGIPFEWPSEPSFGIELPSPRRLAADYKASASAAQDG